MYKSLIKITLLTSSAALMSSPVNAHHGSNGQFDMEATMRVQGVVTKARFVNPHSYIYFDVIPADGSEAQEWRCEHRAGSVMKRAGWTTDMFTPGTKLDIIGAPARREEFGCYIRSVSINGGPQIQRNATIDTEGNIEQPPRELTTPDGRPNFSGNWAYVREARGPGGAGPGDAPGENVANNMAGPGGNRGGEMAGPPPGGGGDVTLTAAGQKASTGYEREDNPRFHCKATNIFHDFWFDEHVNKITQTSDMLTINYGFMDIVREIHINGSFPHVIKPSRSGYSIGKWDGDTLVVTTKAFLEGYLDGRRGTKHSDQFETLERFSISADGARLVQNYQGTDGVYFKGTYSGDRTLTFTTDSYESYGCEDLTQEIVDGF